MLPTYEDLLKDPAASSFAKDIIRAAQSRDPVDVANDLDMLLAILCEGLDDIGILPLSKFTISDLRQAGWLHTMKLAKTLAKDGVWKSYEYHHSSSWYNKVRFFDPTDLVTAWAELPEDTKRDYLNPKPVGLAGVRVTGSYTLWGGNRRHPRNLGQENFSGLLENGWIHLDGGGGRKKKADGNHITFEVEK